MILIPASVVLGIRKAMGQIAFIARSYGLEPWRSPQSRREWRHDLEIMLYFDDLERLAFQTIGPDAEITF